MARFDAYANPDPDERGHTPFLLDVQNEHISGLQSRVVIPLRSEAAFGPRARDLNPLLDLAGQAVVLDTAALAAVPLALLRPPAVPLTNGSAEVLAALDTLFGAY